MKPDPQVLSFSYGGNQCIVTTIYCYGLQVQSFGYGATNLLLLQVQSFSYGATNLLLLQVQSFGYGAGLQQRVRLLAPRPEKNTSVPPAPFLEVEHSAGRLAENRELVSRLQTDLCSAGKVRGGTGWRDVA